MSQIPADLKYTKDHEWGRVEGDTLTVGITDFAQKQLGDIVFVELPEIGTTLDSEATFGVVESIKSVSDLFSPLAGEVVEVNNALEDSPELINSGPYDNWIIKIKMSDSAEADKLLNSQAYEDICNA